MTRLQFFIDHIGKRVFRTKNTCPCKSCIDVYENGLIVNDERIASYLASVEAETNIRYYATIGERNDSENIIPDNQTNQTA